MHTQILALLGLAGIVASQTACTSLTSNFPPCATSCIASAATAVGCTNALDFSCNCNPARSSAIQASAFACVFGACSGNIASILGAQSAGSSICSCAATATNAAATVVQRNPQAMITPAPGCNGSPCEGLAQAVPVCGQSCILSAASASAGCVSSDYQCQCSASAVIQAGAQGCVLGACGLAALDVLNSVGALCSCVTANPTTPCPTSEPSPTERVSSTTTTSTSTSSETSSSSNGSSSSLSVASSTSKASEPPKTSTSTSLGGSSGSTSSSGGSGHASGSAHASGSGSKSVYVPTTTSSQTAVSTTTRAPAQVTTAGANRHEAGILGGIFGAVLLAAVAL